VRAERPEKFTVYLRVPGWAGSKTSIAINGKSFPAPLQSGSFAAIEREWKDGDRIEYTIDMPFRLESIEPKQPNIVALLHGPVALFAIDPAVGQFTRAELLGARQQGSMHLVQSGTRQIQFRTFDQIQDEKYRLYHEVSG
jgi:DUF1680 family protein